MGSLDDADKSYLARNLLAFFHEIIVWSQIGHVEAAWGSERHTPSIAFESAYTVALRANRSPNH